MMDQKLKTRPDFSDVLWSQKYRPKRIGDMILPSHIEAVLRSMVDRGEVMNMTFASYTPGTGKTTAALALCHELGLTYKLLNGSSSNERGIGMVSSIIEPFAVAMTLDGKRKVVIIDEADQMTIDAQKALRSVIEATSATCSYILTCNYPNKLEEPLLSRCMVVDFSVQDESEKKDMMKRMAKRLAWICKQEGYEIDDRLKKIIKKAVIEHFPDFRSTIGRVQRVVESGSDDSSSGFDISELIELIRDCDEAGIIDWTAKYGHDPMKVIIELGNPDNWGEAEKAVAILAAREGMINHKVAVDPLLNLRATIFDIMLKL